jgi:serine/threonine protein kinase
MKYPRKLSSGANNTVIVLSDTEVAKLFTDDTRSDIGSEAEKMVFANTINGLMVKFVRLEYNNDLAAEMLVMERLKPFDFRAFEVEVRELWYSVFEDELTQLHKAGFVHRDLKRPSDIGGAPFDNILLTEQGLRLIDVGISAMRSKVNDQIFKKYLEIERQEMVLFKSYFLNR